MTKKERISEHFAEPPENFEYRAGVGWFYKNAWIGHSLYDMQHQPFWRTNKLPGRDSF